MQHYYELGSDTPDYSCSSFESIQREVAQNMLRKWDGRVTLADMARVDLIELFHPDDQNILTLEAVTFDGVVVGTWGTRPERPISEYYRDPIDAERARERMEAAE
jgi:hypothetical protein